MLSERNETAVGNIHLPINLTLYTIRYSAMSIVLSANLFVMKSLLLDLVKKSG